ncbi:hypothetical protein niasHS_003229 [Heterodera schachtii]|uniref:Cytidine deaminase n=2 Tax=Heterodera TaxID=34509 RepID=A0ABD2KFW2_HETSC
MENDEQLSPAEEQMLIEQAQAVQRNSHSPYSKFAVGAAILNEDGQIFRGANVENASYGATICAERSAICSAISAIGPTKFCPKAICVVTDLTEPGAPCGICRQTLVEFGDMAVLLYSRPSKKLLKTRVQNLLPMAFTPNALNTFKSDASMSN